MMMTILVKTVSGRRDMLCPFLVHDMSPTNRMCLYICCHSKSRVCYVGFVSSLKLQQRVAGKKLELYCNGWIMTDEGFISDVVSTNEHVQV